jgi:hypothetical protein
MSRARKIPNDLHNVASLAGTTAVVVEGAAVAAEKAQAAADLASEIAAEVKGEVAKASKGRGKKILLLLVLGVLAAVGIAVWKQRSSGGSPDAEVTDLRADSPEFAGSMP